jgi:hypothetical protein
MRIEVVENIFSMRLTYLTTKGSKYTKKLFIGRFVVFVLCVVISYTVIGGIYEKFDLHVSHNSTLVSRHSVLGDRTL